MNTYNGLFHFVMLEACYLCVYIHINACEYASDTLDN